MLHHRRGGPVTQGGAVVQHLAALQRIQVVMIEEQTLRLGEDIGWRVPNKWSAEGHCHSRQQRQQLVELGTFGGLFALEIVSF